MPEIDTSTACIAVVMLTMNQCDKTMQCLASLHEIKEPDFRILLWDNGSQDGTAETVAAAFPEVMVHHHPTNLGVAAGRNAAAELAIRTFAPSHLLFLDNDMVLEPDFVRALFAPFAQDPLIAQTQAKLRFMKDPQRLNDGGGCRIQFWLGRTRPVGYGELDRGQFDTPTRCVACGGAMMVRTDVFQELEGFDVAFNPFGPEDLDFSLRVYKRGYYALYVPQAVAYHEVSHSVEGGEYTENYARHKAQHWWLFMKRHASFGEWIGFVCIGAPYRLGRMIVREGRRGNLAALRGIARGCLALWKPRTVQKRADFQ